MGTWSYTVLGSDNALDREANLLFDVCGIDQDELFEVHSCDLSVYRELIIRKIPEMVSNITEGDEIGWLVLGTILIRSGAPMSDSIKQNVITAARTDNEFDNNERRAYIQTFIHQLENYDETPTTLECESLFSKIFKDIAGDERVKENTNNILTEITDSQC